MNGKTVVDLASASEFGQGARTELDAHFMIAVALRQCQVGESQRSFAPQTERQVEVAGLSEKSNRFIPAHMTRKDVTEGLQEPGPEMVTVTRGPQVECALKVAPGLEIGSQFAGVFSGRVRVADRSCPVARCKRMRSALLRREFSLLFCNRENPLVITAKVCSGDLLQEGCPGQRMTERVPAPERIASIRKQERMGLERGQLSEQIQLIEPADRAQEVRVDTLSNDCGPPQHRLPLRPQACRPAGCCCSQRRWDFEIRGADLIGHKAPELLQRERIPLRESEHLTFQPLRPSQTR